MGRRPIGREAMTPTQYQQRWRAKKKQLAKDGAKSANREPRPRTTEGSGGASPDLVKAIACYEAYKVLKDEMAAAASAHGETEQFRITNLLGSVLTFLLRSNDPPAIRSIHELGDLYHAMFDLACGGRPALFFKARQPGDPKVRRTTIAHAAQAYLAISYAALVERGRRNPADAMKWLDNEFRWRKLGKLVSGKDVQGWYYRANATHGKAAPLLIDTYRSLEIELSAVSTPSEADAFAKDQLNVIAILPPPRLKLRR